VGKPQEKTFVRSRSKREDNILMDLAGIKCV
jgi:hypothetical protein